MFSLTNIIEDNQSYCAFQDYLFHKETGPIEKLVTEISKSKYLDTIRAPNLDNNAAGQTATQQSGARLVDDWGESTDEENSTVKVM